MSIIMSQQSSIQTSQNQIQTSNLFELENQFILRLPVIKEDGQIRTHPAATKLREALQKANQPILSTDSDRPLNSDQKDDIKERLFIELNTETRKGKIKFDDDVFEARLVDLPCIIESLKTSDKKTFFKTNDICQMLVCKTKDDPWSSSDENDESKKEKKDAKNNKKQTEQNGLNKKYMWPHGIAPPLKNVRRKRFRKVAKKKIIDYCEIEKEVKQLFRADREAVKVDYEVLLVDGELEDENLDEENKNSLNDEFDDSSQEDENNQMKMNAECSNTGYLDSIQDNLTSNTMNQTTNSKVKKQIEESNMSSAIDDDDSIMLNSKLKSTKKPVTFDELSNDNSNFPTTSSKPANKYFVEEVIGDLSSSSEEEEDEDENKESENDESKLDASANVNHNEESNFADFDESKDKTKNIDLMDTNTMDGDADDDDDDDDEDDKDNNKNNFPSSLSSSPNSNQSAANNKAELRNRLNQLEDELARIKEERRKLEIQISSINNPVLKKNFSSRLNNLIDDETKKTNEIEEIKSLLNE